jgi:hypothetical protein
LLELTRLQQLSLEQCSLTADAIVQISSALTALTQVQLAYTAAACSTFGVGSDELVEAAAAWALLPLVSLSFGLQCSSSAMSIDNAIAQATSYGAGAGGGAGIASYLDSEQGGSVCDSDEHGVMCGAGSSTATGVMLEQLAQLRGLTSLRIETFGTLVVHPPMALNGPCQVTMAKQPLYEAAALAACLRQLTALQSLHFVGGGQSSPC